MNRAYDVILDDLLLESVCFLPEAGGVRSWFLPEAGGVRSWFLPEAGGIRTVGIMCDMHVEYNEDQRSASNAQ